MLRLTKPKYDRIWNVNIVLQKIEECFPLKELTLGCLTERLVLLLALDIAHRTQTLTSIKLSNIKRSRKIQDRNTRPNKNLSPRSIPILVIIANFSGESQIVYCNN